MEQSNYLGPAASFLPTFLNYLLLAYLGLQGVLWIKL